MKRTNLIIDEVLLEDARRISGIRTYSETVNEALKEFLRYLKVQRVYDLRGSEILESTSKSRKK